MDTTNGDEDVNGDGDGHDEQGNKTSNATCANDDESTSNAVNGHDSTTENANELNPKGRLFKFTMVNSYGSVDIDFRIRDDDKALKLSSKSVCIKFMY